MTSRPCPICSYSEPGFHPDDPHPCIYSPIPEYRVENLTPSNWEVWTNRGGKWHAVEIGISTRDVALVRCRRWWRKEVNKSRELALELMASPPETPEEVCIAKQRREHFQETLATLPWSERRLILLHFGFDEEGDVAYTKMARALGWSKAWASRQGTRILFKLQKSLEVHVDGETRRLWGRRRLSLDPRERERQKQARQRERLDLERRRREWLW